MYLLELDNDGLIKNSPLHDAWKGIKEFRKVYEKYGIEGMTVVALATDYESPQRHYVNDNDRFIRSVEEVYENRDKLKKNELITAAIEKYSELQYNPDLERERQAIEYKRRLIERIGKAMKGDTKEDETEVSRLNDLLKKHEASIKDFYNSFDRQEVIQGSAITSNGYELSRIENDIRTKKNSKFTNEGKSFTNPNKLGISDGK